MLDLRTPTLRLVESATFAEKMEDLIQCSVCLTLPDCNIYHCNESDLHLTCRNCYDRLPSPPRCPTCRDPFPSVPSRSQLAEQVIVYDQNKYIKFACTVLKELCMFCIVMYFR